MVCIPASVSAADHHLAPQQPEEVRVVVPPRLVQQEHVPVRRQEARAAATEVPAQAHAQRACTEQSGKRELRFSSTQMQGTPKIMTIFKFDFNDTEFNRFEFNEHIF